MTARHETALSAITPHARSPLGVGERLDWRRLTGDQLLLLVMLFWCVTKFFPVLFLDPFSPSDPFNDTTILRWSWVPLYLLIVWRVMRDGRRVLTALATHPLLVILCLLPMLSTLWSIAPGDTARRSLALFVTTLFGILLGSRYRVIELLYILAIALAVVMGLSLVFALFPGRIGVMWYPEDVFGSWRGVFTHKNELGMVCSLNLAVLAATWPLLRRHRFPVRADLLLTMFLLLMTGSRTALIVAVIVGLALISISLVRSPRMPLPLSIVWLFVSVSLGILLWLNMDELLAIFGRDSTLTGRTELWDSVVASIAESALVGYGYQAFWIDQQGPALRVWQAVGWMPPNAHSGYLELCLSLGAVGATIFAASVISSIGRSLARVRRGDRASVIWSITFLAIFLVMNLSESHILEQNDIVWILYVATAVSLARPDQRWDRQG